MTSSSKFVFKIDKELFENHSGKLLLKPQRHGERLETLRTFSVSLRVFCVSVVNFFISKQLLKNQFLFPIKKPAPSVLQKGAGLIFFKLLRANGHGLESYDAHPVKQFDKWIHRINFIPLDTEIRTTRMTVVIVVVAFTQH